MHGIVAIHASYFQASHCREPCVALLIGEELHCFSHALKNYCLLPQRPERLPRLPCPMPSIFPLDTRNNDTHTKYFSAMVATRSLTSPIQPTRISFPTFLSPYYLVARNTIMRYERRQACGFRPDASAIRKSLPTTPT